MGKVHFVVLKDDGSVWSWRIIRMVKWDQTVCHRSQLSLPIPIKKSDGNRLLNIKAIAAGGDHTVALDQNGNVWTWGRNVHLEN